MGLQHRPAYYAAKNVLAALVSRPDAVGDEEGHAPGVVGDDAHGAVGRSSAAQFDAGVLVYLLEDRCVDVRVVDVEDVLDRGGGPFQAHAGVDAGLGQRGQGAVLALFVLVEDEVPDLQEARVAFVRRRGRTSGLLAGSPCANSSP